MYKYKVIVGWGGPNSGENLIGSIEYRTPLEHFFGKPVKDGEVVGTAQFGEEGQVALKIVLDNK